MNAALQEAAIIAAQDAIANYTTEQEIASAIKAKFEQQFPSTYVSPIEHSIASCTVGLEWFFWLLQHLIRHVSTQLTAPTPPLPLHPTTTTVGTAS